MLWRGDATKHRICAIVANKFGLINTLFHLIDTLLERKFGSLVTQCALSLQKGNDDPFYLAHLETTGLVWAPLGAHSMAVIDLVGICIHAHT